MTHLFSFKDLRHGYLVLLTQAVDDDPAGVVVPRRAGDVQHATGGGSRLNIVACGAETLKFSLRADGDLKYIFVFMKETVKHVLV